MRKQGLDSLVQAICKQDSAFADDVGLSLKVADLYHVYDVLAGARIVNGAVRTIARQKLRLVLLVDVAYIHNAVRLHYLESFQK